jgi:hypothetical protein
MKSTATRRARQHFVAHEHIQAKNENRQIPTFFGGTHQDAFFHPSRGFGEGQLVQPKCEECEKEEKVQKAEKKEEEKPIQKKSHREDEDEPIQMKGLKVEEEEKVLKQEAEESEEEEITFTPTFSERGVEEQNTRHFANCEGVTVEGHTDANYGNSFTAPGASSKGKGCTDCAEEDCVTNTGTVISVFTANPVITLPSVPSGLNECEQQAVQNFINTTLRAHEQQHVAAFNTYRGTVRTPYTYRGCASGLDAHTRQIHDNIESTRKTNSDAASAALDANGANMFNVTCECPDPEPEKGKAK